MDPSSGTHGNARAYWPLRSEIRRLMECIIEGNRWQPKVLSRPLEGLLKWSGEWDQARPSLLRRTVRDTRIWTGRAALQRVHRSEAQTLNDRRSGGYAASAAPVADATTKNTLHPQAAPFLHDSICNRNGCRRNPFRGGVSSTADALAACSSAGFRKTLDGSPRRKQDAPEAFSCRTIPQRLHA
jgi:hypothetical protein